MECFQFFIFLSLCLFLAHSIFDGYNSTFQHQTFSHMNKSAKCETRRIKNVKFRIRQKGEVADGGCFFVEKKLWNIGKLF